MALLDRQSILTADDLGRELVTIPEWGGDVYVSEMTAAERDAFEAEWLKNKEDGTETINLRARLVARVLCSDSGERIFTDSDADALGRKSAAVVDRLFAVAQRLNGMSAADVEQLEKN